MVEGKSRGEEIEPHVLTIGQAAGPISERKISEQLDAAGLSASRSKTHPFQGARSRGNVAAGWGGGGWGGRAKAT